MPRPQTQNQRTATQTKSRRRPSVTSATRGNRRLRRLAVQSFFLVILGLGLGLWWQWHQFFVAHSQYVSAEGGIVVDTTIGDFDSLSPFDTAQTPLEQDLTRLLYEGLLHYNPTTGLIEGALAELQLGDGTPTYTLKLKESAMFADGTPVTLDDVLFTYQDVIQHPDFANTTLAQEFEYVDITTEDDDTIIFRIPEQNVFFASFLTTPILKRSQFEGAFIQEITDPNHPGNVRPIGAGPFRYKSIVPNDDGSFRIFLERNDHYYRGTPNVREIVLFSFPSYDHLKVNREWTHLYSRIPVSEVEQFTGELYDEYNTYPYVLPRWTGLFYNLDRPLVGRLPIRRALNFAVDKSLLIEPGWSIVNSAFFFDGVEGFHTPDLGTARELLDDTGFIYDDTRALRTNGPGGDPLALRVITTQSPPLYSRIAQKIVTRWETELGLDITFDILERDAFQQAILDRDYDVILFGQNFGYNFDQLSAWHSSKTGFVNLSNLTNDTIDVLIHEIQIAGAQSDIFALRDRLEDLEPALPLLTPEYSVLVSKKLFGFAANFGKSRLHADRFYGVEDWYMYRERTWDLPKGTSRLSAFWQWLWADEPVTPPSIEDLPESVQEALEEAPPLDTPLDTDSPDSTDTTLE